MRDKRFIAAHRGGPLQEEQHHQLIEWACRCARHVSRFSGQRIDERLKYALNVANLWRQGKASVDEARTASLGAIRAARECPDAIGRAIARSIGHAVATAHMADHSLGAAWYALKAVMSAGGSTGRERHWQDEQLPPEIRNLVLTARRSRNTS